VASQQNATARASPAAHAGGKNGYRALPGRTLYVLRRWPVIPIVILTALVLCAVFAPAVAPYDPTKQNLSARNAPGFWDPSWYEENGVEKHYFLGADHVGRDVFSRLVFGARISLTVMGIAVASGLVVGVALGIVSGYFGGWTDEIIQRIVDIWNALPFLLIALVAVIVYNRREWDFPGGRATLIMLLLALLTWSNFVKNIRVEVLSLREREYVYYARVAGASHLRIMLRHLLPGVINTSIVIATLSTGGLVLTEAALSFLGAGIPPPTPAWGLMVAEGREYVTTAWWLVVIPGIVILLVVMSLNFLGDWLRDRLDPRLRQLA
jgi:peptide/nickel transport system permease protein